MYVALFIFNLFVSVLTNRFYFACIHSVIMALWKSEVVVVAVVVLVVVMVEVVIMVAVVVVMLKNHIFNSVINPRVCRSWLYPI